MRSSAFLATVGFLALAGCGSESTDESSTNQAYQETPTGYSAAESSSTRDETSLEGLKETVRFHARCWAGAKWGPDYFRGFIDSSSTAAERLTVENYDRAARERELYHLYAIDRTVAAARGGPHEYDLAQYKQLIITDITNSILNATDKPAAITEAVDFGNSDQCKEP